ncbi:MAG: hypothetical protein IKD79_06295 [Oscillospiraceae bacterium]|nr:hypothetical protein [Oscillospiraceae bacterium]
MKKKSIPRGARLISAAGLAVMAALFVIWWLGHPGVRAAGRASALCCVLLFSLLGVRFAAHWMEDWGERRREAREERLEEPVNAAVLVRVFFACLGTELAALGLFWLLRVLREGPMGLSPALHLWTHLDTWHYLNIAEYGYLAQGDMDRVLELVFLPGYPLAVRAAAQLTGNYLAAGFAVSLLSVSGAGVVLYRLARLDMDHGAALRTLRYTLILPGAVFFPGPMSESLFFLLCVSCVYLARRKKWLAACVLGALASFTRSPGLVLAVPVGYELISDTLTLRPGGWSGRAVRRRILSFAALAVIPLGFGVYCLICWRVSGDPFRFLVYQKENWGQSMGLFFNTASYQAENAIRRFETGNYASLLGLWIPNILCVFGALLLMTAAVRRLRPAYAAFFLVYYVMVVGPTWLLSAPRYLAAAFPLGLAMASLTEKRRWDAVCTAGMLLLYAAYDYVLVARWQVW